MHGRDFADVSLTVNGMEDLAIDRVKCDSGQNYTNMLHVFMCISEFSLFYLSFRKLDFAVCMSS